MLRILLVIAGLFAAGPALAGDVSRFDALYGELLGQYWRPAVTINGIETTVFEYAAMQHEAGPLMTDIVDTLDAIDPVTIKDPDERKAFWINVYCSMEQRQRMMEKRMDMMQGMMEQMMQQQRRGPGGVKK